MVWAVQVILSDQWLTAYYFYFPDIKHTPRDEETPPWSLLLEIKETTFKGEKPFVWQCLRQIKKTFETARDTLLDAG